MNLCRCDISCVLDEPHLTLSSGDGVSGIKACVYICLPHLIWYYFEQTSIPRIGSELIYSCVLTATRHIYKINSL